ncbi:hypothetical protein KC345_g11246 [Hortaea werneckii]|nr:hypothetical protein KC345_g11246 [Hortaea werneckii]
MRKIYVFDTTLRDGEQSPGVNLNTREKVEIAYQLEKLGIDRMEAGFPAASPGDLAAVNAVAKAVKNVTVIGLSRSRESDIDAVKEALQGAQDPCIHIFLATSPIHRQHKLRMEKAQVLETAQSAIRYAKKYFSKLEFSLEDAGRTERDFMAEMVAMAIREGANVVNIPDTVGYLNPSEYGAIFKFLKDTVPDIERVQLSAHCHNDLGMATANTLAAIQNGADQIEGTINGIGERAGNTAIEEVALALETRSEFFGAKTSLVLSEISRTSRLVSKLTGMVVPGNKAIVGANAFAHESGIHQDGMLKEKTTYEIMTPETIGLKESKLVLGKHSGRHAFRDKLSDLGYDVSEEEINTAFAKFKDTANGFGWGITTPGHNLSLLTTDSAMLAIAAAPFSHLGKHAPLVFMKQEGLPDSLMKYTMELQPKFKDSPAEGPYNHAWLTGDTATISGAAQSGIDDMLEISSASGDNPHSGH